MTRGVGGRGPANILRHLKGLKFPATKELILKQVDANAKAPGMPDTLIVRGVLDQLPDDTYISTAQILKAVQKIK